MINVLNPELVSILHGIIYRLRFLINYIIIGFISIVLELFLQTQLVDLGLNIYFSITISLLSGIIFAFFGNVFFNFKIPKEKRNQAFIYFVLISLFSSLIQLTVAQNITDLGWTYEQGRIVISGSMFMLGYLLHRKFSFRDRKKVGVAIYANGVENVKKIYRNIGYYLDFVHVDIVDKTMNQTADKIKTYRLETIKAYWPNKQIHIHIMSKTPSLYINEILPYSDVIFVHAECEESINNLYYEIKQAGKKFGIALSLSTKLHEVEPLLKLSDEVLLLTIKHLGVSGQKFEIDALEKIRLINKLSFRNKFSLCIDGGVNEDIVNSLQSENIVSGSSILNNADPKKQIMRLQTASRYGSL